VTSRLSKEQQDDILYWPQIADIGIFAADTVNKKIRLKGWSEKDFSSVDFKEELDSGKYDNGIAIRSGRTISGKYYLIAIDFDGIDAVLAWFGDWEQVLQVAKRTRIEWHEDKWRLHMFLLANRPIKNKKIHIKDSLLEVKCERQALFVSPSIHKEGKPYSALDTSEIVIINENQLLQLESKIDSLSDSDGYMSDEDKQVYIKWLEDPENYTKLGVGQGRHNGLLTLGISYYYRYNGEWKDYTDEQRREKLWDWNSKLTVPLSQREFDDIWKWIIEKHRRIRDEQHEKLREERRRKHEFDKSQTFSMYNDGIKASLEGKIWTEIAKNPIRWIIADPNMKSVYKAHQYDYEVTVNHNKEEQREKVYKLSIDNTIIRCIPTSIIKHESPLDFLQNQTTYTMTFKDTTNRTFNLVRKTIVQIMDYLKSEGYIMPGYGATEALSAIITAFREDGKLSINRTINAKGLYRIDNKLVPVRLDDEYLLAYDKFMSLPIEERQHIAKETVEFIEYIVKNFKAGVIPTALKIGIIAPANFALKQYTNDIVWIPSLFTYGWPRTGKTTVSVIPSALYFPFMSTSRKRPYTSINSEARFGYFMCQDTFPVCVNEMKALNGQDPKAIIMIEMLKSAIETQEARSVMNNTLTHGTVYPAFRQVNFSSNAPPPRDVALRARFIIKNFTPNDSHTEEQKKAFHKFIGSNAHKLRMLGNFAIGYLCQYPEVLFKPKIEDVNWEESAKEIIAEFYKLAGLPRPSEWLDLPVTDDEDDEDYETDEINNTAGALRTCLLNHFNETYNRYIRNLGDAVTDSFGASTNVTTDLNLRQRIDFCIDKNLTPHFKKNNKGKLIIFHSILDEIWRRGIESDEITSLKQFAEILDMRYGSLRQNNKLIKCVHDDDLAKLSSFLTGDDCFE
jgi:Bifunctional DNA primase/polymerase, N-terminal